ncbi:MAG: hypothetical protein RL625_328 [Gemmatimonadota bacterium]|jgi:type II secretory pathway pseudopilin PulG
MRGRGIRRWRAGFTLLELLVILTLIGIITRVTLPKLRTASAVYDFDRAFRQFAADLQRAQSEAWRRNRNVTFTRMSSTQYKASIFSGTAETVLFQRAMDGGSAFSSTGWGPIIFRAFGPPQAPLGTALPAAGLSVQVQNTSLSASSTRTIRLTVGGAVVLIQ